MVTEFQIEHVSPDCTCTGKVCKKCEKLLCIKKFYKVVSYRNWLKSSCIICVQKQKIEYNKRNRNQRNISQQIYHDTHKTYAQASSYKRYALKKQAIGMFTLEQWEELKQRYKYTCLACGKKEPNITLTVDHIIPLSKNGTSDINNIQPLCSSCNKSKKDRIIDYRNMK